MTAITAEESRRTSLEAALPFLVFVVLYALMVFKGDALLNDADTYWHLVVGGWILAHGFPHTDPFSFTFAGHPWIAKEWLAQVVYFAAWRLAGWTGVAALAAGAIALALALLARALQRAVAPLIVVAAVAIAFMLLAPHALARPHALALPVAVAWVAGLVAAADRKRAPSWWLVPLMVLWANLHGGFTFGILLVGAFGLDAIVAARPEERWPTGFLWARFAVVALVAGCVTPYGPGSMLVTVKVLGLGPALSLIGEWKPADFSHLGVLEFALLFGTGLALFSGFRLPAVRVLILLGLTHMALSAERNAELLGLLAPLVVAAPLARQFPAYAAAPRDSHGGRSVAALSIAFAAMLTVALGMFAPNRPADAVTPAAAVAALKAAQPGHVMNAYDFGGYLVWQGVPSFIDGRTELYGGPFVADHFKAVTLADLDGLETALDKYDIGATLLPPGVPAVAYLDTLPNWKRLYSDDIAVVHVRTK